MPRCAKRRRDHAAGEPLAVADDQIVGARRQLADRGQPAENFIQRFELIVDPGSRARRNRLLPEQQLRGRVEVPVAQPRR